MKEEVKVSVCVITYNHAPYIEKCLEGILEQKTSFRFEVIVGDDASTDGTSALIAKYSARYPDKIRHIMRTDNIGSRENFIKVIAESTGEFIAICEGDDFWVAEDKLQRQYEALLDNPSVDICFHSAIEVTKLKAYAINEHSSSDQIIPWENVVLGGGRFMATASLFIRKDSMYPFPGWFREAPVGDVFLQAIAARRGGAYFIASPMAVYRRYTPNSKTDTNRQDKTRGRRFHLAIKMSDSFDKLQDIALNSSECEVISQSRNLNITNLASAALRVGLYREAKLIYEIVDQSVVKRSLKSYSYRLFFFSVPNLVVLRIILAVKDSLSSFSKFSKSRKFDLRGF